MSIIVIEGSNGVGKSTIIKYLEKKYDVISKKSIPDWFRKYIIYARTCEPNIQKKIYLIGHEANFQESKDNKNYIFDRFYYSTIIRLNYQLGKSISETINEILKIDFLPKQIFYITANEKIIEHRLLERDNSNFDLNFYKYENEVYKQLLTLCDIINLVDNSYDIDDTIIKISNIISNKNLMVRKRK